MCVKNGPLFSLSEFIIIMQQIQKGSFIDNPHQCECLWQCAGNFNMKSCTQLLPWAETGSCAVVMYCIKNAKKSPNAFSFSSVNHNTHAAFGTCKAPSRPKLDLSLTVKRPNDLLAWCRFGNTVFLHMFHQNICRYDNLAMVARRALAFLLYLRCTCV